MTDIIIKVKTVYGDTCLINKADFENLNKIQLPFYTKTGKRFYDTARGERAFKKGEAVTLHRGNITELLAAYRMTGNVNFLNRAKKMGVKQ